MSSTPEELKREFVRKWGWEFTPKNIGEGEEYEWHPHKCLSDLNDLLDKLIADKMVAERTPKAEGDYSFETGV